MSKKCGLNMAVLLKTERPPLPRKRIYICSEDKMTKPEVEEEEIEAAEKLSSQREFDASLALLENMLTRAADDQTRIRILFDIVTCSTWLNHKEKLSEAIEKLQRLPDYEISRTFIVMAQARVSAESGHAQEALDLINANLASELLQSDDLRSWRYEHLFWKGRTLLRLASYDEALRVFDSAHRLFPEGEFETEMLIDRSNCLLALHRYADAYDTASEVLARGDEEMATLAMQHMAESRMWQSRVTEALELYSAIQKRLPNRLVDEERVRKGIANAMRYLEGVRPQGKPY